MSVPLTKELVESSARSLLEMISRIHARGWCDATSGNYSVLVRREPTVLLITRSGVDKGRISAEDLLPIGQDGRPIGGRTDKPSAETAIHLTLVRDNAAAAVLHTHSVWGTLLSELFVEQRGFTLSGYEMLKGIRGVDSHRDAVWGFLVGVLAFLGLSHAMAAVVSTSVAVVRTSWPPSHGSSRRSCMPWLRSAMSELGRLWK